MGKLFDTVRELVEAESYLVGEHAAERLEERSIMEWQVVAGLADGVLLAERPNAKPNAAVEVEITLPDGTDIKAVWSLLWQSGVSKTGNRPFFRRGLSMTAPVRVKRMRLVRTDRYVVAVEVELVVPPDDPSEPCYEPATVQLLRQVRDHAERGDEDWLRRHGKVYRATEPTPPARD